MTGYGNDNEQKAEVNVIVQTIASIRAQSKPFACHGGQARKRFDRQSAYNQGQECEDIEATETGHTRRFAHIQTVG
jgi:hypothetical protein